MKAIIVYGPSGSGKSTKAVKLFSDTSELTAWIERDRVRFDIVGLGNWKTYKINQATENIVDTYWKFQVVEAAIMRRDIIISDTLCKPGDRDKLEVLLLHFGYSIEWIRMDTSLEECIKRDAGRGDMSVGENVVINQYNHFMKREY